MLARLASTVVALESDAALAALATQTLAELEIDTVAVIEAPLDKGFAEQAPYDVIFLDGAVGEIPEAMCDQLADGGRLVCVVGGRGMGKATVVTNHGGVFSRRQVFDAATPPLPRFVAEAAFVF